MSTIERIGCGLLVVACVHLSGCLSGTPTVGSVHDGPAAGARSGEPQDPPAAAAPPRRGTVTMVEPAVGRMRPEDGGGGDFDVDRISFRSVFEEIGEDAALWYQHVQTLANPYFEGRVNGAPGMDRARDYIEWYFRTYGLEPAFPESDATTEWVSYRQKFDFRDWRANRVNVASAEASIGGDVLVSGDDFTALANSGSGTVAGPITFVGYGIEAGEQGYTSFDEDTDLTGRIAVLLRYEPLDDDGVSQWADANFSPHAGIAAKMASVASRGAVGIVMVNPPGARDGRTGLESMRRSRRFGGSFDIPIIQMTPVVADRMLQEADDQGRDLMTWRRLADAGSITTVDLSNDVNLQFNVTMRQTPGIPAANMGAVLPGRGRLADEYLVIGGHFDHNGYGMFGTTPDRGPLFPGADDNASGTAGMLVMAKRLAEAYAQAGDEVELRSVLFLAFDAEERGLHGSRYYSQKPTVDPANMTACLNMDMIGRLRSNELFVLGTSTARGFQGLLQPHFEASGMSISASASGSGRSDDANFDRLRVPALHFFTGMHAEYTTPQDKAYTVNPIGAVEVIDLVYDVAIDLVSRPEKLVYKKPDEEDDPGQDRAYAPVRLGIRPGMGAELETGVLIESVSSGTSAAEAGIKAGDIILEWDGEELDGVRGLFESLGKHKPGDVVKLTVRRGRENLVIDVTLKASEGR